jgi:hypothetical protein
LLSITVFQRAGASLLYGKLILAKKNEYRMMTEAWLQGREGGEALDHWTGASLAAVGIFLAGHRVVLAALNPEGRQRPAGDGWAE